MARSSGALGARGHFDRHLASLTKCVSSICAKVARNGGRLESMLSAVTSAVGELPRAERDFAALVAYRCAAIAIEHDPFDDDPPDAHIHRVFKQVHADDVVG